MADDPKVDMEAKLKAFPMKEMGKDSVAYFKKNAPLLKKFEKIEYSEKLKLDRRKWTPKKLEEGLAALVRYDLQIMSVRFDKMIKDGEKGDAKKLEAALTKEFNEIKKDILDKVSLALEELASGKGDNAKPLKECKAAFDKMGKVNFNGAFDRPRKAVLKSLTALQAEVKKGNKGKPDFDKANKDISAASDSFDKTGKLAETAIDFLLKTARSLKTDKEADAELVGFSAQILKYEKKFDMFLTMAKGFSSELDGAVKALKTGALTEPELKAKVDAFSKMTNVDKSAQEIVSGTRKLKPAFQKIEKKLK